MATSSNFPDEIESLRLLRPRQVIELIGFSNSRIRQLEEAGEFPRRIALGAHAVAWRASEIRDWVEKRAAVGAHAGKGATAETKRAAAAKRAAATAKPAKKTGGR
jgi:prophage regulatory protein